MLFFFFFKHEDPDSPMSSSQNLRKLASDKPATLIQSPVQQVKSATSFSSNNNSNGQHNHHQDVVDDLTPPMPLSPKSPVRSHSVHSTSSMNGNNTNTTVDHTQTLQLQQQQKQIGTLIDELQSLRVECENIKKNAARSQQEIKSAYENELNELRRAHDDQMRKLHKNIQDIIVEIDDEKKTRLALQVELERLKKTIMNN